MYTEYDMRKKVFSEWVKEGYAPIPEKKSGLWENNLNRFARNANYAIECSLYLITLRNTTPLIVIEEEIQEQEEMLLNKSN